MEKAIKLYNLTIVIEVLSPPTLRGYTGDLPNRPTNLKWNDIYHNIISLEEREGEGGTIQTNGATP